MILLVLIAVRLLWDPCMCLWRRLTKKRSRSDPDIELQGRIENVTSHQVANELYSLPKPIHGEPRRRRPPSPSNIGTLTTDYDELRSSACILVEPSLRPIPFHSRPLPPIGIPNPTLDPLPEAPIRQRVVEVNPVTDSTNSEASSRTALDSLASLFAFK